MWKYKELLPLKSPDRIVSLGEGGTPLVKCRALNEEAGVKSLYIKDETRNPTFSFKDRMASVMTSIAVENGIAKLFTSSSGNEAASLGCYSSRAGIKSLALVHSDAVDIKLSQVRFYEIILGIAPASGKKAQYFWQNPDSENAGGSFFGSAKIWREAYLKYGWYPSTAAPVNPYHKEGYKTIAYEIFEQLNWRTPDFVIIPVGSGDNLAAEWKAFQELKRLGLTSTLPRMIATQRSEDSHVDKPSYSGHVLSRRCLDESKGHVAYVSSSDERKYLKLIARQEGLLLEPVSAQSVACVRSLVDEGMVSESDVVVCVGTGSAIKYPEIALRLSEEPARVEPSTSAILDFLRKQT
jgi:threonine synthase